MPLPARQLLFSLLGKAGFVPARRTPDAKVLGLIEALKPVDAGYELIRLGPDADGGYLVPDDLEGLAACFSPGVDEQSGFELACAERGMDVFMADASVDGPAANSPRFDFEKKFLAAFESDGRLTLDGWAASKAPASDDLMLQIDIEGAEYEVLLSASATLMNRFRLVVIELHNVHHLWNSWFYALAGRALEKLLATHTCVHAHPNNTSIETVIRGVRMPKLLELTFLRNDRVRQRTPATRFPHPLDVDCGPGPTMVLPEQWRH